MRITSTSVLGFGAALAAGVGVPVAPALAAQPSAELQEVVVTAEKRETNLQDAPISIVAFNEEALSNMGVTGLGDLTHAVPNMTQITWSVGNSTLRFYIRGIGQTDSQLTGDSPVGVYLDGVYVARTSGLAQSMPDIERVEVLRGPQGTLFGRNTTGGAINIVTQPPTMDDFKVSQTIRVGDYEAFKSSTMLNVPVSDKLAVKVAYLADQRDGTVNNTGGGNNFNAYDNKAARVAARWKPTDAITLDYAWDDSRYVTTADLLYLNVVSPGFAGILPEMKHREDSFALPFPVPDSHTDTGGNALTASIQTPIGEVKSISAYRTLEFDAYQDQSANSTIEIFRNKQLYDHQHQFSEELQLIGATANAAITYVAGLYYFRESGYEIATDEIAIAGLELPRHIDATNKAYAAYTSWTWVPGGDSRWSYTLGGRYSKDERDAYNYIDAPVSASYDKFTPSGDVSYKLTDTSSIYARIATGYNAGGFNMRAADFTQSFGPESLTAYEIGMKSELLNHRLRLNGATFFSDYTDIQFTIQVPGQDNPALTETLNAGKEQFYGLELDATYLITDSLVGSLSYGYLGGEFKKAAPGDDLALYRPANAPKNTVHASLDWTMAHFASGDVSLYLDYTYQSTSYTTPRNPYPGIDTIPGYGLFDAQLKWNRDGIFAGRGGVSAALWIKNAFDKEYFVDSASVFQGLHALNLVRYGDPRTYGAEVTFRY